MPSFSFGIEANIFFSFLRRVNSKNYYKDAENLFKKQEAYLWKFSRMKTSFFLSLSREEVAWSQVILKIFLFQEKQKLTQHFLLALLIIINVRINVRP